MKVALHNRVKIYNLTSGKSQPDWDSNESSAAAQAKRKKQAHQEQEAGGLELIQDLDFPHFARCLFRTADGSFFFAAGDYPPRLKCFDVKDMSQKFSFNADMPICGGVSLSPDFRKFALRSDNRQITIHNTAHIIDRLRVPHTQRCMTFHENTAEILSGGTSSEVFRISLDTGAFVESYKTCSEDGVNAIDFFPGHGLTLAGGENGVVDAFDPRAPPSKAVGSVNVASLDEVDDEDAGITSLAVEDDAGYCFCAGTSTGQVALFDIRLNKPLLVKDHLSELPIVKILFHRDAALKNTKVASADSRAVKIWERETGTNMTTVEAPGCDIYDIMFCKQQNGMAVPPFKSADSGVLMMACDCPKVQVHFIPDLGRAPNWCTFLDSMAENFDESEITTIYDDYKFVSAEEAQTLGVTASAIAAGKVRPAMHGFFIEINLYRDLKAVADPGAFVRETEERKKQRRQDKLDNRISSFKRIEKKDDDDDQDATGMTIAGGDGKISVKALEKSLPDDVKPLLKSMTPETMELLARDPRFAARAGKGRFAFDPNNSEFVKLFRQIGEKRQAAAERREKYEHSHFKVVPDSSTSTSAASGGTTTTSKEENEQQQYQRKQKQEQDDESEWTREALRHTSASASKSKRRTRALASSGSGGSEGEADEQEENVTKPPPPRRLVTGKVPFNSANSSRQQQHQQQQQQNSNSARTNSSNNSSGARLPGGGVMMMEATKNAASMASDVTMHKLRKKERHKAKLSLEERLKRQ